MPIFLTNINWGGQKKQGAKDSDVGQALLVSLSLESSQATCPHLHERCLTRRIDLNTNSTNKTASVRKWIHTTYIICLLIFECRHVQRELHHWFQQNTAKLEMTGSRFSVSCGTAAADLQSKFYQTAQKIYVCQQLPLHVLRLMKSR